MIEIQKKNLNTFDLRMLRDDPNTVIDIKNANLYSSLIIEQCIIDKLDLAAFHFYSEVVIRECIINELIIPYCWFRSGIKFENNIVLQDVDYQAGVHNEKPFVMNNNIFRGFLDFFDCQFTEAVYFSNNILEKGSSLFGNKGEGFENMFDGKVVYEGNIGQLDLPSGSV